MLQNGENLRVRHENYSGQRLMKNFVLFEYLGPRTSVTQFGQASASLKNSENKGRQLHPTVLLLFQASIS